MPSVSECFKLFLYKTFRCPVEFLPTIGPTFENGGAYFRISYSHSWVLEVLWDLPILLHFKKLIDLQICEYPDRMDIMHCVILQINVSVRIIYLLVIWGIRIRALCTLSVCLPSVFQVPSYIIITYWLKWVMRGSGPSLVSILICIFYWKCIIKCCVDKVFLYFLKFWIVSENWMWRILCILQKAN